MCNYITAFSLNSCSGNLGESFVALSNPLLSCFAVKFDGEDDNRGSGR
jgi:hypothetical protein